jgi:hypothetical protein
MTIADRRVNLRKIARRVFGQEVEVDLPAQRNAFRAAFSSPAGKRHMLPDILEYTGVLKPAPMHGDVYAQGRVQGRRDVGLHILEHLNLQPVDLYAILKGQPIIKPEDFTND